MPSLRPPRPSQSTPKVLPTIWQPWTTHGRLHNGGDIPMANTNSPQSRQIAIHPEKPVLGSVIILSLCAVFMQAETPADSAVFSVFKQADSGLAQFALLQRTGVTGELDLVIAIGGPRLL